MYDHPSMYCHHYIQWSFSLVTAPCRTLAKEAEFRWQFNTWSWIYWALAKPDFCIYQLNKILLISQKKYVCNLSRREHVLKCYCILFSKTAVMSYCFSNCFHGSKLKEMEKKKGESKVGTQHENGGFLYPEFGMRLFI